MKPTLKQSKVTFRSDDHTYWLKKKQLVGITSTLIKRAFPDTYKVPPNYTDEEWEEVLTKAAEKGSLVHETIELYEDLGAESDLPELQSYIRLKEEHHLTHVASEYVVSDDEHYATAIDSVMQNENEEIILVDFKRTSTLHIENVTLQQSICKRFFEKLNPKLKVAAIYVMWLRDDKSKFVQLHPWADEALDALIEADLNDQTFDIATAYGALPYRFAEVEDEVARLENAVKEAQARQKELKEGLYALMEESGVKSWSGAKVKLTRILPTTKVTFDTKSFQAEHPDLYEQYCKESETSGSLRITIAK